MAFSSAQKVSLCQILGVTAPVLDQQLATYASYINADVETAVGTAITTWATYASKSLKKIHPNAENFGAEIDYSNLRGDLAGRIATLLGFDASLLGGSGSGSNVMQRG